MRVQLPGVEVEEHRLALAIATAMAGQNALQPRQMAYHLAATVCFFLLGLTVVPRIENGYVYPMEGPGLGVDLQPGVFKRKDLTVRRTSA